MGSLLVFGCWLHFVSNIVFFFLFFGLLVFCFFGLLVFCFLVFPLNWDRLGSQKIAQNLNFGEDFARNHCKTQCFCIIFCMKNISQEHPFCFFRGPSLFAELVSSSRGVEQACRVPLNKALCTVITTYFLGPFLSLERFPNHCSLTSRPTCARLQPFC